MEILVQQNMNKIHISVISALFSVIMQLVVAISYRHFEPTCQSHPQVSRENLKPEDVPIGFPETSVRNYHYSLRNNS